MRPLTSTTVSPSPRDLVAKLSDEEKIAIDLLLAPEHLGSRADGVLAELVPDEKRRGYLRTLALQLAALGIDVQESAALDDAVRVWNAEVARCRGQAEERRDRERARLEEAPPAEARRAVARQQRRRRRGPRVHRHPSNVASE